MHLGVGGPGVYLLTWMSRHHSDQAFGHQFPNCSPCQGSIDLHVSNNSLKYQLRQNH